jgi:hypothetical protein
MWRCKKNYFTKEMKSIFHIVGNKRKMEEEKQPKKNCLSLSDVEGDRDRVMMMMLPFTQ